MKVQLREKRDRNPEQRPRKPRKFRLPNGKRRPRASLCQCHRVTPTGLSSEGEEKCIYATYPQSAVIYAGRKISPYCHFLIDRTDWKRMQIPERHRNSILSRDPDERQVLIDQFKALGLHK